MLFTVPFSAPFWICYLCGGFSDILDGMAARILRQQSEFGAKLDSIADLFFGIALGAVLMANIQFSAWVWICAACTAMIKLVAYVIGAYKYHSFSALHTYANKLAGLLLFAFPLLYKAFSYNAACILLCSAALAAAVEELVITIRSKELHRNFKGLLFR